MSRRQLAPGVGIAAHLVGFGGLALVPGKAVLAVGRRVKVNVMRPVLGGRHIVVADKATAVLVKSTAL